MDGTSAQTGQILSGINHLRQSIVDILTTPIGSRVMRREYGSKLPFLVDAPINASTLVDLYAETADALYRWEPRFRLTQVNASSASAGSISIDLTGIYLPDGQLITMDGVKIK